MVKKACSFFIYCAVIIAIFAGLAASRTNKTKWSIYTEWPFDCEEAVRRQDETAGVIGIPKTCLLDLSGGTKMKLALIPAGNFMMGSPLDEDGRCGDESPQHKVTISKPFYIGIYEVTEHQWHAVMGTFKPIPDWRYEDGYAANYINWNDAVAFCKKLSTMTARTVYLPTEAQWEYACRAGSTTRFYYGDDHRYCRLGRYAWYLDNPWSWYIEETCPVGKKKRNAWGLYDMHGNVWEWCSDWYDWNYSNAENIDPQGPASGWFRVLRGGSFNHDARFCRSADRGKLDSSCRRHYSGFRVVVSAD